MRQNDALQAVLSQIDGTAEDIIASVAELVRIPSISGKYEGMKPEEIQGGETKCNEALRSVYEAAGCQIDFWEEEPGRANLVGVVKGAGGGRSLIFNGHIDTAPPGDPSRWKWNDPFSGRIEDGKLYGRGSCDMKAGLVAQAKAAEALKKCGIRLKGDLILESVVGEETMDHESGTTATLRRGYVADAAVVAEPTAFQGPPAVAPCSIGVFELKITVKGKATHPCIRGSLIWPGGGGEAFGVNAIDKALLIANALRKLEYEWAMNKCHPLFPPGYFTIGILRIAGQMQGVSSAAGVPDYCLLTCLVQHPPEESADMVKAEVEQFVQSAAEQDHWLRANPPVLDWPYYWPPYSTPIDHPICRTLEAAHEEVLSRPAQFQGFAAVDDAVFLQRGGVPAISYGPGTLLVAHFPNEHVAVDEVIQACKVYAATAIRWCGLA
jgi:acetylornithine deacetylase/succinyl-diaminopimelate desuccinylase family protein